MAATAAAGTPWRSSEVVARRETSSMKVLRSAAVGWPGRGSKQPAPAAGELAGTGASGAARAEADSRSPRQPAQAESPVTRTREAPSVARTFMVVLLSLPLPGGRCNGRRRGGFRDYRLA